MRPHLDHRRVLVIGGTGVVGSAVLKRLAQQRIPASFTYFSQSDKAAAWEKEYGQRAHEVDLTVPHAASDLCELLAEDDALPNTVIHCAAISENLDHSDIDFETWHKTMMINGYSGFSLCQSLAPELPEGGDFVFLSALGSGQSLPTPVHFAASQGLISSMTMALARELASSNIRVNAMALGPLQDGLSRHIPKKHLQDYENFSALRRRGTAQEAAKAILWLALENSYISGKVVNVNGGI